MFFFTLFLVEKEDTFLEYFIVIGQSELSVVKYFYLMSTLCLSLAISQVHCAGFMYFL